MSTLLVLFDGIGINDKNPAENALLCANAPTFQRLFSLPHAHLGAHGVHVGLEKDQMGNSEVGHMTIGGGRIGKQSLVRINELFAKNEFWGLPAFTGALKHLKEKRSNLHIMTLFWPGGVHAHQDHLEQLLELLPSDQITYLHLFGDGRDLEPRSMGAILNTFMIKNAQRPNIRIASIGGRYYGMDRDKNWTRVERGYRAIASGSNLTSETPAEFIQNSYAHDLTDEFLEPTSFGSYAGMKEEDVVFFLNFRADRARQITKAFTDASFKEFPLSHPRSIQFVTMTSYYDEYSGKTFLTNELFSNTIGDIIAKQWMTQLHLAETEKYAHVTFFFNGGRNEPFPGETDLLIPSHKVATYDLDPAMSATEILEKLISEAPKYDFTVVNFANGDMVGHTGKIDAAIRAVETIDHALEQILRLAENNEINLFISADHGNCEEMGSPDAPKTAHTLNPVPFWFFRKGIAQPLQNGTIADIAPTILHAMGIEQPGEMTGKVLL